MIVESAQKKNYVYNSVFADIIRNNYDCSSLITEKNLVEKYHVSKSPVREALLQLCNDGILLSIPRLGYRVKPINMQDLIDATNFRIIVEQAAIEISIKKITDSQIEELEQIYDEAIKNKDSKDPFKHWESNSKFHMVLCLFSGNRFFAETLKDLLRTCYRGANQYYHQSWAFNLKREDSTSHKELLDAIKARDVERGKKILKKDIMDFQKDFLSPEFN